MALRRPEPGTFENLLTEVRVRALDMVRLTRFPATEPYWSKGVHRFDDPEPTRPNCFGCTYAAESLDVAFAESIIHECSRFVLGHYEVPLAELVTAGQPNAAALATLAAHGFAADIYLAPLTVHDAVRDEPEIVRSQGLAFIHIPIAFNEPDEGDFARFTEALAAFRGRKVLAHCQVNMRASSMVFLHRVIVDHEAPETAYEAVTKVWSPNGTWRRFIVAMLRQHRIAFDPY